MSQGMVNRRNFLYSTLLLAVIMANYLVYRLPELQPVPEEAVIGSAFDFLLVIPLIIYLWIIRKRYSFKYIGLAILAGYGAASLIIPQNYFQQYSFFPYLILSIEGLFILAELYLLYKVVTHLSGAWKKLQLLRQQSSFFQLNIRETFAAIFPDSKVMPVLATELSLFYYALFSWRSKAFTNDGMLFSYHKKTSTIAVYMMLIHATLIETIAVHYFLHQWNVYVSLALLMLNLYGILYFLAEIQAIRLTPFLLTDEYLHLYPGLAQGMSVPLDQIACFREYEGPAKLSRTEQKDVFTATVKDLELETIKPQFELTLHESADLRLLYGLKKKVHRILLNVDQPAAFKEALTAKLDNRSR